MGEFVTGLGFVTGIAVLIWSASRQGLATDGMAKVAAAGLLGGIAGAKLTQLIYEGWPTKVPWYVVFDPRTGGKALMGGLLIGWFTVVVAKRLLGIKRSTGDHFALALPAGEAVGRIGCFLNGCCFGRQCDLPWSVHQHGLDRHPTQIYSAVASAMLFSILFWLKPRLHRDGDLWRCYLIGFGSIRFVLESFRENEALAFGLSSMQLLCIELLVFGTAGFALAMRRESKLQRLEVESP